MCAVIKDVRRQNILNGTENFVCTVCFALNKDIETTVAPLSVNIGVNLPEYEITVLESSMLTVEVEVETTEKEVETPTALVRDNEPIPIEDDEVTLEESTNPPQVEEEEGQSEGFWEVDRSPVITATEQSYSCDECNTEFSTDKNATR